MRKELLLQKYVDALKEKGVIDRLQKKVNEVGDMGIVYKEEVRNVLIHENNNDYYLFKAFCIAAHEYFYDVVIEKLNIKKQSDEMTTQERLEQALIDYLNEFIKEK